MAAISPEEKLGGFRGREHYRRRTLGDTLEGLLSVLSLCKAHADAEGEKGRAVRAWIKFIKGYTDRAQRILDAFRHEEQRRKARADESAARTVRRYFTAQNPLLIRLKLNWELLNVLCDVEDLISDNNFLFLLLSPPRECSSVSTRRRPGRSISCLN